MCKLTSSLGGIRFGTDGEGNVGYFGADDCFIPFKSGDFCHETGVNSGSTAAKITATLSHTVQSKGKISITQIAYCSATNGDDTKIFTITKNGESITPNELYKKLGFSIHNTKIDCKLNDILEITSGVKSTSGSYAKLGYIEINMIE